MSSLKEVTFIHLSHDRWAQKSIRLKREELQKSLAERLFNLYEKYEAEASKKNSNQDEKFNVLWLTENYRCNELISLGKFLW